MIEIYVNNSPCHMTYMYRCHSSCICFRIHMIHNISRKNDIEHISYYILQNKIAMVKKLHVLSYHDNSTFLHMILNTYIIAISTIMYLCVSIGCYPII